MVLNFYETGINGHWLYGYFKIRGIENLVAKSSIVAVNKLQDICISQIFQPL